MDDVSNRKSAKVLQGHAIFQWIGMIHGWRCPLKEYLTVHFGKWFNQQLSLVYVFNHLRLFMSRLTVWHSVNIIFSLCHIQSTGLSDFGCCKCPLPTLKSEAQADTWLWWKNKVTRDVFERGSDSFSIGFQKWNLPIQQILRCSREQRSRF